MQEESVNLSPDTILGLAEPAGCGSTMLGVCVPQGRGSWPPGLRVWKLRAAGARELRSGSGPMRLGLKLKDGGPLIQLLGIPGRAC